jgi:hypothetical protein
LKSKIKKEPNVTYQLQVNALDVLVLIYHGHLPSSSSHDQIPVKSEPFSPADQPEETTDTLFLRGHLSVLFGLLMRDNLENQVYLLRVLRGETSLPRSKPKKEVLNNLVEEAHSFSIFYASLNGGSGGPPAVGMSALDQEGKDEGRVARDVVRFLEGLRARA